MESHCRGPDTEHPLTGLNHSLRRLGMEIHVQTEDRGARERRIETQVFCDGRVVLSTCTEYPDSLNRQQDRERLAELMRRQHFNVIRELETRLVRQADGARHGSRSRQDPGRR